MNELTLTAADLATVAGGSVAAGIVTQFAKMLFGLSPAATRTSALVSGLVFVVGATVLSLNETSALTIALAALVGMQAGMAASATFDAARAGINYRATRDEG